MGTPLSRHPQVTDSKACALDCVEFVKGGFDLRLNSLLTSQSYAATCEPTLRHKDEEDVKIGFALPPPVPVNAT